MARQAHTCPKCDGHKKVNGSPCPTCGGEGVVFDGPREVEEAAAGRDPLDLTYDG